MRVPICTDRVFSPVRFVGRLSAGVEPALSTDPPLPQQQHDQQHDQDQHQPSAAIAVLPAHLLRGALSHDVACEIVKTLREPAGDRRNGRAAASLAVSPLLTL